MKKIYALFMTLCLIISATAAPLVGTAKKSYPLYQPEVVKAELALDAMQKAPAATQGLQYDAEAGELIRYYNETDQIAIDADYLSKGNLYIDIMAADKSDYLTLLLFLEDTVEGAIIPEGTYPITSTPAYNTALASQGYVDGEGVYPCAYYPLVEQAGQFYIGAPMYFMQSGNIVVEHVNGTPKITINAVNSNNVPMTIVYEVGGKSEKVEVKTPLKYDATEADGALDYTFAEGATATATDKGFYGTYVVDAADASCELGLLFIYPEGTADAETTIPAGTYTISDSQAPGTVMASSGYSSQGLGFSFFINVDAEGYIEIPMYFLVSGTVEVTKVDGGLKVEVNGLNSNDVPVHVVYVDAPAEPEYALEETVEISNLTTETLTVGEATYLQLIGRNDMLNSDVQLFLNNYTGEDKEYEVNVENSLMTFGGTELTVVEGKIAQATDPEKGQVYTGRVIASAEEEGEVMLVALDLIMYATPAIEVAIADATARVDEETGSLVLNAEWTKDGVTYPVLVLVAGYEEGKEVYEGAQISELQIGDDDNWLDFAVANTVTVAQDGQNISVEGEYTSWATGTAYALTISGQLPEVEEPVKPEPTYTENNLNTYAFGLESVLSDDKTTLTVTYRLNNSNATSVNVVIYNGEDIVASVPGTTTIGKNTVEVATGNLPAGVELKWAVEVNGTSVAAPTQEAKIYSFYHPSGVDVDNNPENPTFGMLLVNEAMQSVASKTEGYVSAQFGAGIFAFTPSFDLIPNGDQPGYNGGKTFSTVKNDFAPRRIRISEDGRIFATAQDGSGEYLWEINPENLNDWTTVFQGTNDGYTLKDAEGNFIAGTNSGFDVRGEGENLQLLMLSASLPGGQVGSFKCHTYDLGTATTWATAPTKEIPGANYMLVTNQSNAQFDKDGGVWYIQYRGTTTESEPGLVHINKDGVEDLKQLRHYTRNAGFRFTDDFSKVIIAGVTDGSNVQKATIYAVSQDENGAPVLTEETVIETSVLGNNLNDFAWDYAGNLYACGNSAEKLVAWAMPYSGQVVTPAATQYTFVLPEPIDMVGTVKRAVQNGNQVIVLTHEENGAAHIYQVVDGKAIAEVSQEGVVPVDTENPGSYLAISDIAVTEDGKLVANNYVRNQFAGTTPEAGYKLGTSYYYIWNDLAGAPAVWFTSQTTARSSHGDVGVTFALKGTSTNAELLVTAVHNNNRAVRLAKYNIIDGQYVEPNIPGGQQSSEYYEYFGTHTKEAYYQEAVQGKQFQLNVSPLGEGRWIMDGELVNPSEFVLPAVGENYEASATLTEDLGKKYNGASYVTVGEKVLMVAPFANPDGQLVGAEILDITKGLDAPQYVDMVYVDEAVAATAAATAVEVVEGGLNITLVADAAIHTWFVELSEGPEYQVYEDAITNLVIDYDNLLLIGGPSDAFQVEVVLGLGDFDRNTGAYQLLPASTISVMGSEATFIDGVASVDGIEQSATAVVHCTWNGMAIEFHLTMTSAPMEATKVVVENATVEIEKVLLFGDMYDYALKMTGVWHNEEDGLDYPVLVEVPVYYPEATEPSTIFSTVTVGGWGDEDPWLGFGEGDLTITTVDNVITATGIVQNPMAGVAIDITISGKLETTALENLQVTVKPVKMIQNGQLIIKKGDVQYNANGAVIK